MGNSILYALIDALQYGLPYAMLALGVFITYRQLDIADLGCEGTFTLGGVVSALFIYHGINPFLATLIAIVSGFLAGIVTGLLHTQLKIPALLSGIITLTGLFSINMVLMGIGTRSSQGFDTTINFLYKYSTSSERIRTTTIYSSFQNLLGKMNINLSNNLSIIILSILIVILVLAVVYLFFGTEVGMSIRATGMNGKMARAQGINTSLMIVLGLGISNALIALGGSLTAQITRSANSLMGTGIIVLALSSVIIGESIFGKRSFKNWIISVSLGAIVYYLIIAIALALNMPNHFLKLLYAVLIVIVLSIPLIKELVTKFKKKEVTN